MVFALTGLLMVCVSMTKVMEYAGKKKLRYWAPKRYWYVFVWLYSTIAWGMDASVIIFHSYVYRAIVSFVLSSLFLFLASVPCGMAFFRKAWIRPLRNGVFLLFAAGFLATGLTLLHYAT